MLSTNKTGYRSFEKYFSLRLPIGPCLRSGSNKPVNTIKKHNYNQNKVSVNCLIIYSTTKSIEKNFKWRP